MVPWTQELLASADTSLNFKGDFSQPREESPGPEAALRGANPVTPGSELSLPFSVASAPPRLPKTTADMYHVRQQGWGWQSETEKVLVSTCFENCAGALPVPPI